MALAGVISIGISPGTLASSANLTDGISGGCSDEVQALKGKENPQQNASRRGNESCRLKIALGEEILVDSGVDSGSITTNIVQVSVDDLPSVNEGVISIGAGPGNAGTTEAQTQAFTPAQEEIPAPATLLLLLAGAPGLLLLRRRTTVEAVGKVKSQPRHSSGWRLHPDHCAAFHSSPAIN